MNSIPAVGPDLGVAPRSGSASPQTPSQQRADTAPTVIADSDSARADPGVLLKVVPPARSREDGASVRADGSLSQDLDRLETGRQAVAALGQSAAEADLAVAKRVEAALAALPADVQEAIRQASSPAMAHLLRLAAMTRDGIKHAPAVFSGPREPLADTPQAAALTLHESLRAAGPFQIAVLLRDALLSANTASAAGARQFFLAQRALLQDAKLAQSHGQSSSPLNREQAQGQAQAAQALGELLQSLGAVNDAQSYGPMRFTQALPAAEGEPLRKPSLAPAQAALQRDAASSAGAPAAAQVPAGDDFSMMASLAAPGMPADVEAQTPQQSFPLAHVTHAGEQAAARLSSPQQTEQALRDGLKIIMDGRMVWTGQFTPGVWMAMERTDAWRADREHPGGMQKGSSLRFKLELPNLGIVEIRALGFGGQVSARVQAEATVTPKLAEALPALQERLRQRGLSGAQVLIESS